MDSEKIIRELADRQAISDVISAYCERFDRNDPEGVAALFTPDARIDYNPDTPTLRGSELAASVASGLREIFAATSHHVSNLVVSFEGRDRAHSQCYIYAWHRYHGDRPDGELWGRYLHRFVRADSGWLISDLLLQGAGTVDFHRERMHGIGRR